MPLGKPTTKPTAGAASADTQKRGVVHTTATYTERGHKMRTERFQTNLDPEDVGADHAVVKAGHSTKTSIEFQTVETVVMIELPVKRDDASIRKGFLHAWHIVEEELEKRQTWAKEVIDALTLAKRNNEGR